MEPQQGLETPFGMDDEAPVVEVPKHKRNRKAPKKAMPEGKPGVYVVQLRHAPFAKALKRGSFRAKNPADAWEQFLKAGAKHKDEKQVAAFLHWCNDRDPADDPDIEIKLEQK